MINTKTSAVRTENVLVKNRNGTILILDILYIRYIIFLNSINLIIRRVRKHERFYLCTTATKPFIKPIFNVIKYLLFEYV